MVSVSPSRNLIPPLIRAAIAIPKPTIFHEDHFPFIPFSKLREIKLLESQLIATLDSSTSLGQIKQTHAYIIRKGLHQSSYIIAKLIRTLSKVNEPVQSYGVSVFSQLHGESVKLGGFELDLFVGNGLIDMYVKCGWLDNGRKIFDEMPERDLISWTSLIVAYAKEGDIHSASELFHGLPVKDMVAWTAMVTGLVQNGKPREAMEYFERMQNAGVETDEVTIVAVINACAQLGAMKYGNWIREVAERSGFDPSNNVLLGSALIDMYSKCGSVDDAYAVFKSMNNLNVYSYSSMIVGLASHGRANSAIKLFEEMVKTNVKPNTVTFIGVLAACSHAGLVEQGRSLFAMMEKSYCVKPSVDHYNCMVDLLSRTGRLDEALELIRNMKMEPSAGIWGALLGGCRIYANPDIAEVAARHLFKMESDNIGNYILLAQVYAKSGRWNDVLEVRKLIRKKGFKKYPAFSWVEGEKGVIHEFYAGEMTHPRSKEIKEALDDVINRLKLIGYVPNFSSVLYDLGEDEKKQILMHHSEKLAFAYGLITIDDGCAIRIVKNLRICEDCHSFMCGASQITGREIIVRDNMRFHHFHDGKCSCSDFW